MSRGKDVFIDGFTYFNAQELRALETMLRQARSVTVTLLGEQDTPAARCLTRACRTREHLMRLARENGPGEPRWSGSPGRERGPPGASGAVLLRRQRTPCGGDGGAHPICSEAGHRLHRGGAGGGGHPAPGGRRAAAGTGTSPWPPGIWRTTRPPSRASLSATASPLYLSRRSDILEKPVCSLLTGRAGRRRPTALSMRICSAG